MAVVLELLGDVNNKILILIHSFSILILSIFVLELVRDYASSKSKKEFFRKPWLDFILITFLSVYFLFVTFLGFLKFFLLDFLKPVFYDMKEMRAFWKIFKR